MDQMQREILGEIEELVGQIVTDLEKLRATRTDGPVRRELIARIFRSVHSIKGSAASCDLEAVSQIAHEFENLLAEIRAGRVLIDDAVIDACQGAAQALSESVRTAASGKVDSSSDALFEQLHEAAQTNATSELPNSKTRLDLIPFEIRESLTEIEKQQLASIVAEGSPLFVASTSFDIQTFDAEFFRLKEKLTRFGEIISTSPAVDDKQPDKINFTVLYASNADLSALSASDSDLANVVFEKVLIPSRPGAEATGIESTTLPAVSAFSKFVRTPLRSTLDRVARAGRAAARVAAKEVDFEIIGAEIRLDQLLGRTIANPLIQLVRNAVDHGIETATERTRAGKVQRGVVRIEAESDGTRSRLRVSDDGRGVDPVLVTAAAQRLGLLPNDAELSIEQSLRLIFRPGFTTLATVSELSGRGVGLDVVETAVEQLGGELRVSSKPGQGSTFEILLPVSFGLLASNVVVSAGNRYCIPAAQTLGIDAIDIVDGSSGANQLRQVSLRDLLGQPEEEAGDLTGALQLITCQYKDDWIGTGEQAKYVGIVVDRVDGPEEVLVRNLGRHAGRWYGIAGAAELKDGNVALVLDLPRLLNAENSL
jgi:two-component system chemotaxis sensor kinase CheA